ncbi:transposase family protein [Streptomyces sp. NPDC055815]
MPQRAVARRRDARLVRRGGDGRADYSHKHCCHGVTVQVVTDLTGQVLWISPALPGRCHDLSAARTHRIIRNLRTPRCPRPGHRCLPGRRPLGHHRTQTTARRAAVPNRADGQAGTGRIPGTHRTGMVRLKSWRIFRRSRMSPNRMTSIAKAVLTLERQR